MAEEQATISETDSGKTAYDSNNSQTPASGQSEKRSLGSPGIIAVLIYLIGFAGSLVLSLIQLFESQTEPYSLWGYSISGDLRLLLIVLLAGALGSMVHALRSCYWYLGHRQLFLRWVPMYVILPFVGATLGFIFYFVVRAGFLAPQTESSDLSPFGFAALATLAGLFSDPALLKLKEVAEQIFTKVPQGDDAKPQESSGPQTKEPPKPTEDK